MIPHLISDRFQDALQISDASLDKIALDKIAEGWEMHKELFPEIHLKQAYRATSLSEHRIYMAHSIFKLKQDELQKLNEEYAYLAKRLNPVAVSHTIAIPRLIDPVDIETGNSTMMDTRPTELVAKDLEMIESCDYFIYDFRHAKASAGACMELFYAAYIAKIPTVVIVPEGTFKEEFSPWIQAHASYMAWDLDSAAEIINKKIKQTYTMVGQVSI